MAERYVVVLDAGTSHARSLVFDQCARVVGSRSAEWPYRADPELPYLAREFDPQLTWASFSRLIADSLQDAGASAGEVAAITATGQRQALVFLDTQGREVYAGPNLDLRAVFEGGAVDDRMGRRVYETTGHAPSLMLAPAKLRWFQVNRPDAYDRIAAVLTVADWLAFKLSGELLSERSLAGEAGLLDISLRSWCTDLFDDLGLAGNSHVPLLSAGARAGAVTRRASRETGLPEGTPVAVSGADTQCGLLGMGLREERQTGIVAGWSAPLQMVLRRPAFSPSRQTWTGCHLLEGTWVVESSAGDVGNSYRWLAETMWGAGESAFSEMDALAGSVPAGSEGTLAFLGPSRMDVSRLGLRRGGFLFPVPLTFSDMGRGHLVRAALEGIAYAMRANLQQAEAVAGEVSTEIAVGGGMTRTHTWVKLLADVIGREVRFAPSPHVSALGAYLCAATAIGGFASLEEAAGSVAGSLQPVEPDPLARAEYEDLYHGWVEAADRLGGGMAPSP